MNKKMKRNIVIASLVLLVLIGAIVLVMLLPSGSENSDTTEELDTGVDISHSVSDEGLHSAKVNTNDKGEIDNNSYGNLIDKLPAEVEKISVKTPEGNYTFLVETPVNDDGSTESSTYTLEGFEDYVLETTNPALITGAVCNIDFKKIADVSGDNASEYGFDSPRAEATVYYSDSTYSVVRVGDNAPGGQYCYIQFGDSNTVYIAECSEVEPLLLKITDFFSSDLNSDLSQVADDDFEDITLGGTHLEEKIVISKPADNNIECDYVMSSHSNLPVNVNEGSEVIGAIRTLSTDGVVCVNPDDSQIEAYGLTTPYATVETTYAYTESEYDDEGNEIEGTTEYFDVSLLASQPDSEGNVFLMEKGGKIVYKIDASRVPWVTTSYDKLMSEYVLRPVYNTLESVVLEANGKSYEFLLSTEKVMVSDEEGSTTESDEPRVHLGTQSIDPDQFNILFEDLTLMERGGKDEGDATQGELLKITYNYSVGRKSDTVVLYATDGQKVVEEVNSMKYGYVYKSYVTALISNIEKLAQGEEIAKVS